jgi:tetratricopeptide (TPR) repeat protein
VGQKRRQRGALGGVALRLWLALVAPLSLAVAAAGAAEPTAVQRMDALWASREDSESLRRLIEIGENAAREREDFETEWRIARACVFLAERQENRTLKKALAVKGMEWGRKAIEKEPDRVEGHYYYGSTVGQYGTTIGMLTAVTQGIAGKFEASMTRSIEIDNDYDEGGARIALGRFYYVLPWPKKDLERSRRYLEESLRRHPRRLLARLYLADTYYDLGKKTRARRELQQVLRSEVPPEETVMKPHDLARERMQQWFAPS